MKRNLIVLGALAALLALAGCRKDESAPRGSQELTFALSVPEVELTGATKSGIVESENIDEDDMYCLYDEEPTDAPDGTKATALSNLNGKSIGVYGFDSKGRILNSSGAATYSVSSAVATSTTKYYWFPGDQCEFVAVYPAPDSRGVVANTIARDSYTFNYTVQNPGASYPDDLMVATYKGTGPTSGTRGRASLTFNHKLAIVKFTMGTMPQTSTITKIILSGVYKSGVLTVKPSTGAATWGSLATGGAPTASGSVAYSASGALGDAFSFAVLPQTLSSVPVTVKLTVTNSASGASETVEFKLTSGSWAAGTTYTYTLNLVKDLGAKETANCYIIPASAGVYRFSPVKGNSTTSVGTVSTASVIWETNNTATAPTTNTVVNAVEVYTRSDNKQQIRITSTGTTAGNALVGAKDSGGNILWSWHIWKFEKSGDITVYDNAGAAQTKKVMRYNLGALESGSNEDNTLMHGMLYQWGRKDPFRGMANWGNTASFIKVKGTTPTTVQYSDTPAASSGNNLTYSIQNPTKYINNNGGHYHWYKNYTTDTAAGSSDLWNDSSKTIYDPCPPGYRVLTSTFFSNTKIFGTSQVTGAANIKKKGVYRWQYVWRMYNSSPIEISSKSTVIPYASAYLYFPISGICDGSITAFSNTDASNNSSQNTAAFWTSNCSSVNPTGSNILFTGKQIDMNTGYSGDSSLSNAALNPYHDSGRSAAASVRCQTL